MHAASYAGRKNYSTEVSRYVQHQRDQSRRPEAVAQSRLRLRQSRQLLADQSTNGNGAYHLYGDFFLADSNQEPTWVTNAMNGARAIFFQTNAFRLFPFTTNFSEAEVFVVLRTVAGPTNVVPGLWHICNGAAPSAYPWTNGNVWESFGRSTYFETPPTASLISPHLYNVASLLNSWSNRWNNGGGGGELTNTVAFDIDLRLGWSSQDAYFHGYISEIMLFNRGLTTDERNAVAQAYLRRRFGLW